MEETGMPSNLIGISRFESLFRKVANLDVYKSDLQRLNDFIEVNMDDIITVGRDNAIANGRDIIEPWDLPLARGIRRSMEEFDLLDEELEIEPIMRKLVSFPNLGIAYSDEVVSSMPRIIGAITICLAKTFKVLDPGLKNPQPEHWDKAFSIFDMLV